MGRAYVFGKTWWGKAWVLAIELVDRDTNRLPRGRMYAKNGSVLDIEVSKGKVTAHVQGRRRSPYRVSISLPKFSKRQRQVVREIIVSDPALASELGLGRMPERLAEMLEEEEIFLFPEAWDDIVAGCSCPDWANPCKHLAAVYYILAEEIDKDPFLVFRLHGLDTEQLMRWAALAGVEEDAATGEDVEAARAVEGKAGGARGGVEGKGEAEEKGAADGGERFIPIALAIPDAAAGARPDAAKGAVTDTMPGTGKNATTGTMPGTSSGLTPMPEHPEPRFDLPRVPIDSLLDLLPPDPVFYPGGDMAALLRAAYREVGEMVESMDILEEPPPLRGVEVHLVLDEDGGGEPYFILTDAARGAGKAERGGRGGVSPSLHLAGGLIASGKPARKRFTLPLPGEAGLEPVECRGVSVSLDDLLALCASLPLDSLLYGTTPGMRFLGALTGISLSIIRAGAYLPRVNLEEDGAFSVTWRPMAWEPDVARALDALRQMMPATFATRADGMAVLSPSRLDELVELVLSRLFNRFMLEGLKRVSRDTGPGQRTSVTHTIPGQRNSVPHTIPGQVPGVTPGPSPPAMDRIRRAVFLGETYRPRGFRERQTGSALRNWLQGVSIKAGDLGPVVKIDIADGGDFLLGLEVEDRRDPLARPLPLSRLFSSRGRVFGRPAAEARAEISRQIVAAADHLPPMKEVLSSSGHRTARLEPLQMAELLSRTAGVLGLMGIRLLAPRELKEALTPKAVLRARKASSSGEVSYLSLDSILEFSFEVALGGEVISRAELESLLASAEGIVRYKDQYVLVDPRQIARLLERLEQPAPRLSSMEVMVAALTGEAEGIPFHPDSAIARLMDKLGKEERIALPRGLRAELRPYQKRGYKWLMANSRKGLGSCLADDMGLGKTVQALAFLLKLKEEGDLDDPALLVCPTTLLANWEREAARFTPGLRTHIYHGPGRRLVRKGKDLVLTTYGTLRRDADRLLGNSWQAVILDEAQNVKNPETDQARVARKLQAPARLALTGTPMENRLMELWSIFDFLNPGFLGGPASFRRAYAIPIERFRDGGQAEKLRLATSPFIMRRLKTDRRIIDDLPDKLVADEYCRLTREQTALYQKVVESALEEIERSEGMQRRGLVLALITHLKHICDHPVLFTKRGKPDSAHSGKAVRLLELLSRVLESGEKALVFTQYKEMGDLLKAMIEEELGVEALYLHGKVARKRRDAIVEAFQADGGNPLMVLTLKVGGYGLNLTAASNVVHYDLWWNPAVEDQATDRTYRIGQERNVFVYRLLASDTFEERIDEMLKGKRELAEMAVGEGERWITEFSDRELRQIFSLGLERD